MNPQFSFENLDVYKRVLAFSKKVLTITKEIKGQYSWCDQLNRAATSITLNLAESDRAVLIGYNINSQKLVTD